jgi:FKBP-type peptidyl-prolyl cis-trans isomerase SlyD
MTETNPRVKDGMVVGLDYTLRLDDGEVIDSSAGQKPVEFLQGQGQIVSGLEQALYGMAVGDEKRVVIEPDGGYGDRDPNALRMVPRDTFPPELELSPGIRLHVRDESGSAFEVCVDEIQSDGVVLDFNHPLAGETLHFDVKILSLRQASGEELAHGHVHGTGHEH